MEKGKTYGVTTIEQAKKATNDLVVFGQKHFKVLSKASSQKEKWMKSTKAYEIKGKGCLVQVSTQNGGNVAESLVYVPDVKIKEVLDKDKNIVGRELVAITDKVKRKSPSPKKEDTPKE